MEAVPQYQQQTRRRRANRWVEQIQLRLGGLILMAFDWPSSPAVQLSLDSEWATQRCDFSPRLLLLRRYLFFLSPRTRLFTTIPSIYELLFPSLSSPLRSFQNEKCSVTLRELLAWLAAIFVLRLHILMLYVYINIYV